METDEQLYPIAVLIDELKSDDVNLRLNAIRRIGTIALALGPERARTELIAFLQDSLDDEDEVLVALAEELSVPFVDYLGGPAYAHLLLPPLEGLATVEEAAVREKATESIAKISTVLNTAQIEEYYLALLRRLATGEWFTSRTSATALFTPVYPKVSTQTQAELRDKFAKLCNDETPMVRRAAARDLAGLIKVLGKDLVLSDALPLYRRLSSDDQDSVRLLTIEDLVAISELLSNEEVAAYMLPSIRSAVGDKSWRVRYMAADNYVKLCTSVGQEIVKTELVVAFVHLLQDNEAEVRTAATGQIPGFAKLIDDPQVVLQRIFPVVQEVASDASQHVRSVLAVQIPGLAPLLGKDATMEHLFPVFLALLKDDFPEVRLQIISKLDQVNEVIGIKLLSESLLPAIVELAEDKQWRVRQAIIEYIPLLAQQLGVQFFDDSLAVLCMAWLGDTVFSIREAATINLRKLTEVFGVEWATRTILPKVLELGNHHNYLYRMTTIFAISTMAPALDRGTIAHSVLPTVASLLGDSIPNIRFNVAKALEVLAHLLLGTVDPDPAPGAGAAAEASEPKQPLTPPSPLTPAEQHLAQDALQSTILPGLATLKEDPDADVRYFAQKALESLPPEVLNERMNEHVKTIQK